MGVSDVRSRETTPSQEPGGFLRHGVSDLIVPGSAQDIKGS